MFSPSWAEDQVSRGCRTEPGLRRDKWQQCCAGRGGWAGSHVWLRDTTAFLTLIIFKRKMKHLWDRKLICKGGKGADSCFPALPPVLWQTQSLSPWTHRSRKKSRSSNWKRLLFPAWAKMKKKWHPNLLCHHTEMRNPAWGDVRHFLQSPANSAGSLGPHWHLHRVPAK